MRRPRTTGQEIQITAADGGRFAGYLALPSRMPAPGLVVLPEVFNTNPHIRSVANGYAAEGFVVIAPDVYWRQEAGCYASYADEGRAKAQSMHARLDTDQFAEDLGDVIPSGRVRTAGKVGVMGFCLGGKFTYLSSTRHAIDAAVSYYGVQIDQHLGDADRFRCPILLQFAEKVRHVPASTVAAIRGRMGTWEIHVYPHTEHGFNRHGYPPYHEAPAGLAREHTLAHFRRLLS
jgi:carboxymethylenebutenolidase